MSRVVAESWVKPDHKLWTCSQPHCQMSVLTLHGEPTAHKCPYYAGQTRIAWMTTGLSLVEQLWKEADATYERLMECPEGMDSRRDQIKGRLRGLCFSLSLFMNPHFSTEDEVAREIIKRGKAPSDYETPGLGSLRYQPPPGTGDKYKGDNTRFEKPPATAAKTKNPGGLSDQAVATIKGRAGWPVELLAQAFGCTEAVIREVQQSQPA